LKQQHVGAKQQSTSSRLPLGMGGMDDGMDFGAMSSTQEEPTLNDSNFPSTASKTTINYGICIGDKLFGLEWWLDGDKCGVFIFIQEFLLGGGLFRCNTCHDFLLFWSR
jgi:hypothetical protein